MTRAVFTALLLSTAVASAQDVELVVHLSVTGATVTLDEREIATNAPAEVRTKAKAGRHALKVTKDGFQPYEQELKLKKGGRARVEVLLRVAEPEPPPVAAPAPEPAAPTETKPKVAPPIRIAVYELVVQPGVDARVGAIVSESLLAEVRKLERVSAIGMSEVKDMLSFEQQRQLLGCDEESCIAEIGGALGVDELVTGSMGVLGESRVVTIRRLDLKQAQVKGSVQKRFQAEDGTEFLALVGPSIEELFAEYPLRRDRTRGVSPEVVARLNPPPLPRWSFFATAGLAVATGLVGGFYGAQFSAAQGDYERLVAASTAEPVPARTLKDAGDRATTSASQANTAFMVAGGLVVVAGVMALFTDWHGYGDAAPPPAVAVGLAPTGVSVAARF